MTRKPQISADDISGGFVVPPECQGQIVEVSYAVAHYVDPGCVIRRTHDQSDGETKYAMANVNDHDIEESWHPVNGKPDIPDEAWTPCEVTE